MKIIHNNDIEQITFLDERFYLDEKTQTYFPSVNTILDVYPKGWGFQQWLKEMGSNADEVLRKAGEQGTNIHDMIQRFLNGEEIKWIETEPTASGVIMGRDNYSIEEWLMFLKFVEFYKTYKPETIAVELSMVDAELGFGGTLDYICKIPMFPNDIWMIDWKSGGSIYKSNKIQQSAYQKIWNKQRKEQITRLGLAHLKANTRGSDKTEKVMQGKGWKIDEIENPEHLYKLFEYSQAIWKEENPNPKPKNMVYPDRISIEILKKQEEVNKE
jgi:hypothetical protein